MKCPCLAKQTNVTSEEFGYQTLKTKKRWSHEFAQVKTASLRRKREGLRTRRQRKVRRNSTLIGTRNKPHVNCPSSTYCQTSKIQSQIMNHWLWTSVLLQRWLPSKSIITAWRNCFVTIESFSLRLEWNRFGRKWWEWTSQTTEPGLPFLYDGKLSQMHALQLSMRKSFRALSTQPFLWFWSLESPWCGKTHWQATPLEKIT